MITKTHVVQDENSKVLSMPSRESYSDDTGNIQLGDIKYYWDKLQELKHDISSGKADYREAKARMRMIREAMKRWC